MTVFFYCNISVVIRVKKKKKPVQVNDIRIAMSQKFA